MKNLINLLILISLSLSSNASTSITTTSVSGHWTLVGSPYLVYNNIQVNSSQSLKIDPGVQVIFQGSYGLIVNGILSAVGTASQPINFTVNDTTGWSTDSTSTTGGWHGIVFQPYSGTTDTSSFQYCNVSYTKFDSLDYFSTYNRALYVYRPLPIKNCNFFKNKSNPKVSIDLFEFRAPCEVSGCNFYQNVVYLNSLIFFYFPTYCHNNKFYYNRMGGSVINAYCSNFIFENNELNNNVQIANLGASGSIAIHCNHGIVKGNIIHNNTNYADAAIACTGGFVSIDGNNICNNQHVSSACGINDGGGGLNLICEGGIPDSTLYTVNNNVIANNYSAMHGGGININNVRAIITNNQIINNKSFDGGGIYFFLADTSSYLVVKNNILLGNETIPYSSLTYPNISGFSAAGNHIEYDHNWSLHSTQFEMTDIEGYFILSGDTTTNVVGISPGLIAPTLTADVSESAVNANFGLLPTSPCINKGDTAGVYLDSFDFAGNPRIAGGKIDIGAYEFCVSRILGLTNFCVKSSVILSDSTVGGIWTSSDLSIIAIDSVSGLATGVSNGIANISYSVGTFRSISNAIVNPLPNSGIINGDKIVCTGATIALVDSISGGSWTASNSNATISGGLLSGVYTGVDSINYSVKNSCGTAITSITVSINAMPIPITGSINICQGDTTLLSDPGGGIWSSSNQQVATVDEVTGVVMGISAGTLSIGYTLNTGCATSTILTVNPLPYQITGAVNVCLKDTITLSDSTTGGIWSSNDANIAVIDVNSGVVVAKSLGSPIFTYTIPTGCSATKTVTVDLCPMPVSNSKFEIFPNPAGTELTIISTDVIRQLTIINILGQTIYSHYYNSNQVQIDVTSFPNDLYVIKINGSDVSKFVKL